MRNQSKRSSGPRAFSWVRWLRPDADFLRMLGLGLVVVAGVVLLVDGVRFATSAPVFRHQLTIDGLRAVPEKEVRTSLDRVLSSEGKRRSLLGLSVYRIREHLKETHPRLNSVKVTKKYPSTLVIQVEERQPVALLSRADGDDRRIYLPVDPGGTMFPAQKGERQRLRRTLPVVYGLEKMRPGSPGFERRWSRVRKVLKALRQNFTNDLVNWIEVLPGGYVKIQVNRPRPLEVRLGVGQYQEKMRQLSQLMRTDKFQSVNEYVNLSDPREILVR